MKHLLLLMVLVVLAAGCVHTGKNTYDHSGSDYIVRDYMHTGIHDWDFYDKHYAAEHRYHYHR